MFEIRNDDKKKIVVSLHLEEIYIEMCLKTYIKDQKRLFRTDTLTKSCIDYLVKQKFDAEENCEYEYIIDFSHIKYIAPNSQKMLLQWIKELPHIHVSHCEEGDFKRKLKEAGIAEDNTWDYRKAFDEYGKKYIVEKCCDKQGYTTQTGIQLGVYIDIKKIINDSTEMLRWCYIVAYDINNYFSSVGENPEKKYLLFCHTMNGTYISGILSQLLGYNLVYVDHLGPYNKLNKVDFSKGKSHLEEFIIIADMICQGNEFLRAKNIVEYLGGTVRGCAGILKMDISDLMSRYEIDVFAIKFSPEEARKKLGYTIRTKLCSVQCEECNGREI